jgi:hypothetical protein
MRVHSIGSFCLSLLLVSVAIAQDNNGLNRPEVAAIKAKLVAVRAATGGEPSGYALESEDFSLPTKFNPARDGKFWPITSSVYLRFTDKAVQDAQANSEQAAADFQARYMAAVMSGNETAMQAAMSEMMQAQNGDGSATKEDMAVNIQFNMNPYAGIDPDGVLFDKPGVIALASSDVQNQSGQVVIYFDPVALRETETLARVELSTPQDGVSNRSGVFNVTISLNGPVDEIQALAKNINTSAVLAVIDSQ